LSTIWSAESATAQKRAAAATAAKAKIQTELANSIDPLKIEVELSRAQATGASTLPALKKLLAAARAALAKGLSLALQKQALDQITSIKQQIAAARQGTFTPFAQSPQLQLELAKEQALGTSQTQTLLKMKKAAERALKAAKGNIQKQTDIWNQIYAINQQLGQSAATALGGFKQASTRALTKGLGLTDAQLRALRARLSQLGPGGTVPGTGTGAAGFIIGTDGRPLIVHTHVNIDGKRVANNVTRHQQRHRRRNPHQRRGPNAGG
jgi:hypothetical protein